MTYISFGLATGNRQLEWFVWFITVYYGLLRFGMVWFVLVWYGMVCYSMVWYGTVWFGRGGGYVFECSRKF